MNASGLIIVTSWAVQQHLPRLFNDGISQYSSHSPCTARSSSLPVTPPLRRNALTSVVESNTTLGMTARLCFPEGFDLFGNQVFLLFLGQVAGWLSRMDAI